MVIFPQGKNILEEQFIEPVDLVYLWVDGSDPEWLAKKREYLKNSNIDFSAEAISSCRSADNDELKMSLRSVEKHTPWINKIFIVTDNQIPKWLDTSNPKIKVIFHKDFMPSEILPTFNSNVIELYLHKISELSEHFLIANDDTFINCDIKPNFFYTKEGRPIARLQKSNCRKIAARSSYAYSILRMQNLIKEKFGSTCTLEPHHNIDAYTKSLCKECEGLFKEEYHKSSCKRFRSNNDIQRSLILYYALATKQAKLKIVPRTDFYLPGGTKIFNQLFGKYKVDSKYIGMDKSSLHKRFEYVNPKLFCINDNDNATDVDRINAKKFLHTLYPNKSSFEKKSLNKSAISVVIPTIQSSIPLLSNLIRTLEADDSVGEVIIINNAKPKLHLPYSKVKCFNQKKNQFVNKSWNIGIENSSCEYFALINDDLILPKNFCTKILPLLSKNNGIYGIDENCIVNILNIEENNNDNYELFITKTNKRAPGFGIAMFGHIQNYIKIPECLKIFCGDDFLFTQNLKNGKQNFLISGCIVHHCHQLSSGKIKFDRIKHKDCQNYSKIDTNFVIPYCYEKFNFAEKIIGITNVYENNVKIKYLILLGQQIKIGSSR